MKRLKVSYSRKKQIRRTITKVVVFALLIIFGFTFLKPLIQALSTSFMSLNDITDPSTMYVANEPTIQNYKDIFSKFNIGYALIFTMLYAGGSALFQTMSCAFVGYGLARYEFKFKKLVLALIILVFLIPRQTLMTPSFILMGQLHLNQSLLAFFIPAILGQGISSSIFILIFYSFFASIPNEIYEAANLEGAKPFQIFTRITLPLVRGAIVITYMLSFVWYWNETYMSDLYYRGMETYPMQISRAISGILAQDPNKLPNVPVYDGLYASGIILLIIPLVIFYFMLQKQFKDGIENSGMTGQ